MSIKLDINISNFYSLFSSSKINYGDDVFKKINGRSFVLNKNISLDDLRYLRIPYYNYNGEVKIGEMICNKFIADDVIQIFKELFRVKYQIYNIGLIEDFWDRDSISSDEASMHANNSSCFNYRLIAGKNKLSNHALGQAIDINPLQNPYVKRDINDNNIYYGMTDEEVYYANNRNIDDPHIIKENDYIVSLFKSYGFNWGGDWGNPLTDASYEKGDPIDYQHFEKEVINRLIKK